MYFMAAQHHGADKRLRGLRNESTDLGDFHLYAVLLAVVALFVVIRIASLIYNKIWPPQDTTDATADLLQHSFLESAGSLTRKDVEGQLIEAERWRCSICAFDNLVDTLTCHLCGTPPSTTNGTVAAPKSALTHRQKCARSRKTWTRRLCPVGGVAWQWNNSPGALAPPAFVIQGRRQSAASEDIKMEWTPLHPGHANCTVAGSSLPQHARTELVHVADLPFHAKYSWFLQQVAGIVRPYKTQGMRLISNRATVAGEALNHLIQLQGDRCCAAARYEFRGEHGIDAGAIEREWYLLVAQAFLSDSTGLFAVVDRATNAYYIQPQPFDSPRSAEYVAVGRFLGRALLFGQAIPMQFSPVLFKAILGTPLSLQDVELLDPQMLASLTHVLHSPAVDDLALTFSVTETFATTAGPVQVDLIPNGLDVPVTQTSVHTYVDTMVRYLLFDRVSAPLAALVQGVHDIVPPELLLVFDFKELELLVCGLTGIDVDDWKVNTIVSSRLKASPVVEWFWEIVASLGDSDRAKLLQFCTGSSRVPVQGFKGLTSYDGNICHFSLRGVPYTPGAYPLAHACFNRLDLPLYPTKELCEAALAVLLLSDPTGFNLT